VVLVDPAVHRADAEPDQPVRPLCLAQPDRQRADPTHNT
jgi:hypothetical protein